MNTRILITMGDPAGIGPEIITSSFSKDRTLLSSCIPVIIGNYTILKRSCTSPLVRKLLTPVSSIQQAHSGNISVLQSDTFNTARIRPGKPTPLTGKAALQAIRLAVRLIKDHDLKALVTAPVSKEAIISSGTGFNGHTEYIAELTHTKDPAMLMISDTRRVLLATRHIPIKDISRKLTRTLLTGQTDTACRTLKKYFGIRSPHILMCGLNPHNGEGGHIGSEEQKIIVPAVKDLQAKGYKTTGPVLPETAFTASGQRTLIVTNYHDQAMIPLKLLCGRGFVNVTCGLPFLRTSPAHGVAFDIAGKRHADPTSMIKALQIACMTND